MEHVREEADRKINEGRQINWPAHTPRGDKQKTGGKASQNGTKGVDGVEFPYRKTDPVGSSDKEFTQYRKGSTH